MRRLPGGFPTWPPGDHPGPGQTLKDLYDYRTPIYERVADLTVDASSYTIEQTARAIQQAAGLQS